MRRGLGSLSALVLSMSSPSMAQTLIVDDDHPQACACTSSADLTCGTPAKPFSCIQDAASATRPFTAVSVADGTYAECVQISKSSITVTAQSQGGALISCTNPNSSAVRVQANLVTLGGFRITGGFEGVLISGPSSGSAYGIGNAVEDSEIFGNSRGVRLSGNVSDTRLSRLEIHHNSLYDGLKLDAYPAGTRILNTVLEHSHLHHNVGGILEIGGGERTWIHHNEIDNNGRSKYDHGLYMKGFEGLIQDNRIHHNSGHGITLWAAPRGSDTRHYIVERNDVYANGIPLPYPTTQCGSSEFTRYVGAGISIGGTPGEASPPGDGLPHKVEVRYNNVHHNVGPGLYYLVNSCTASDDGNVFHHNTVYDNVGELVLVRAAGTKLRVKDNIFSAPSGRLVEVGASNLAADALNGNLYEQPGATADTDLFLWNGFLYSFNEIRSPGVLQDPTCGTTTTGSPRATLDALSRWTADVRFVDRTMSLWSDTLLTHNGDFHLRVGSDARTNGICCPESAAGTDIDGEAVQACTAQQCVVDAAAGVGADFYLDTDVDGVADRYDCAMSIPPVGEICDGDEYTQLVEEVYCAPAAYPSAPYDPAIFPPFSGVGEICDGKDNDCDPATSPAGGEVDADGDGVFAGCGGDCDDTDPRTFPGSQQVCDGKNNDCSIPNWDPVSGGEVDGDNDGYFKCTESTICTWQCDCDDTKCGVNIEAPEICNGQDDNCSGVIDESFLDGDSDQKADCVDNCPTVANPNQADSDGDGIGNLCDPVAMPAIDSNSTEDGRIAESGETTGVGGSGSSNFNTSDGSTSALRIGDKSNRAQWRSVLSFDTSMIPDNATVSSATLQLKRGTAVNDSSSFGSIWVDLATPFGAGNGLVAADFQAAASATHVGTLSPAPSNGDLSTATFNAAGLAGVSKTGRTQVKIYFNLDDDNDSNGDYVGYYSGNSAAANRPKLTIQYVVP